jgi:PAS domain S-box-containing protein
MDEPDRAPGPEVAAEACLTLRVEPKALAATVMSLLRVNGADATPHGGQERYREILGAALEGIAMVDPKGITAYVNQQMAAMLGQSAAAMIGRSLYDFMQGEPRTPAVPGVERDARGREEHFDARLLRDDGSRLHAIVSIYPIFPEGGQLAGAVVVVTDVTSRTLEESARREADTLRSVAALAAAVKHEINNPLMTLTGNLELLERAGTLDAAGRALLRRALAAADEITRKVGRFGRLTRLELADEGVALPAMLDLDKSSSEQGPRGPRRQS